MSRRPRPAATSRGRRLAPRRGPDPALAAILAEEFGGEDLALDLFEEFLRRRCYHRAFAARLVAVAGARDGRTSWPLRRAAVLMLETLLCSTPEDDLGAFEHALSAISEGTRGDPVYPPGPSALAEGYSSREPSVFLAELRRRLGRLARVHRVIDDSATQAEVLRDFLEAARQECRLTLARYLFAPEEVARRIFDQVRRSRGQPQPFGSPSMEEAAGLLLGDWPAYERDIVAAILAEPSIFWVGEATSSRLNVLVEYPLGTVVLVVKPPGSSLEIEIKRAGRRGDRPLSVVYRRNGSCVPPSHRLDGGSLGGALKSEAGASAFLGRLYRRAHGQGPPSSQTIAHRTIREVPCARGRAHLLDYFTDPDVFGEGLDATRRAMSDSIRAFCREWGAGRLGVPGDLGLTVEFLSQASPTQAVLGGSTSYRLDLLAGYLGDEGPELYFRRGLGVEPSAGEARRFADTLLDEVLGEFVPVPVEYRSQGHYVDAVLAYPANRRRADATSLGLSEEIGRLWGTLFGLRGCSVGESFVGRNVGLKSAWEGGRWRVHFIAMDHDMMTFARDRFAPAELLRGWSRDAAHLHGQPGDPWRSALDWLATIYRLDAETSARGREALLLAASDASRLARNLLSSDDYVRGQYESRALEDARDWEEAAVAFLKSRRSDPDEEAAISAARRRLEDRGRVESTVTSWTEPIRQYAAFLEEHAALLGVDRPTTASNKGAGR